MAKKTRYVALDWQISSIETPDRPRSHGQVVKEEDDDEEASTTELSVNATSFRVPVGTPVAATEQVHLNPSRLPTKPSLPHVQSVEVDRLYPRNPIQSMPVPGKVYFIPDGRYFPESVIHGQKQQVGFFRHPVMVMEVQGDMVSFYAMTKERPQAIRELNMAFRLGTSSSSSAAADQGPSVLRLAPGSHPMMEPTWVNLEQRFFIEWHNLDDWAVHVAMDAGEFDKIDRRVVELEAAQNRYIYKPLFRGMHAMLPGMIIMLPNAMDAATFGAPILVVDSQYPDFSFLRVKRFEDNIHFNPEARRPKGASRRCCLAISRDARAGHDGTPVLLLERASPDMREKSYVEVHARAQRGKLDKCKTWCWPPVRIDRPSMLVLRKHMADIASSSAAHPPMNHQPLSSHPYRILCPPPAARYEHVSCAHWGPRGAVQQRPGYHPMSGGGLLMSVSRPGNYMYGPPYGFSYPMGGPGSGQTNW
ncbi:hypothetical protein ACEQ8H_001943 [Pleosporales sp. CAS-2024a]